MQQYVAPLGIELLKGMGIDTAEKMAAMRPEQLTQFVLAAAEHVKGRFGKFLEYAQANGIKGTAMPVPAGAQPQSTQAEPAAPVVRSQGFGGGPTTATAPAPGPPNPEETAEHKEILALARDRAGGHAEEPPDF